MAYTFEQVMKMDEEAFLALVTEVNAFDKYVKLCGKSTKQKKYPKVLKPSKKIPGKMTYQADKTQQPVIVTKPITFFEVKTAFAKEVLKLEPKGKIAKETFRDRAAAAAQNA
jgi:hypothetical protein